ncbi:cytochrome P450 [Danaus plexippus plexippus]|uniref:Cytochrome P450 n=1 Tax=Danaus plexippus plexippus TaxID=278856 RepID=A0A212FMZ1_DANPL|nr:cytochrome P450 [Danaus plexippus plexippus]
MADKIPGPPSLPILGNALKFMVHNKELKILIKNLMNQYGEVVKFWLGMDLNILVSNPDDLKLLLTNNKTSVKGEQYKYFKNYIGAGLLSGSGPEWRKHRKIATPNFGKQATGSYVHVFNMEADLLLENLKETSSGDQIDVYQYIVMSTSYAVCRKYFYVQQTLMGLTRKETLGLPHLQYVIEESPLVYTIIFERMTKWFMQIDPVYWLTKSYQVEKEFVSRTNELSGAILKLRINKLTDIDENKLKLLDTEKDSFNNTELSVVDRFILSRELDATDLKTEIFTIFTASQEATAKVAASLLLMLAFHPECQKKVYAEITSVIRNKNKHITEEDLKQMPYLEMIFKEVLRLFPTGVMLQRKINKDISISSCTLPAGSSLVIPLYHMHRDSRFWENPESFDPERFSAENMKKRNAYCYFPFSLGPMDCLDYPGILLDIHIQVQMLLAVVLLALVVLGVWVHWRYKNRRLLEMSTKIPGPPTIPILGNAFYFMCRPEEMIKITKQLIDEYGLVLRFWLGTDLNIVVSNPDDIKVLLTNNKVSVKGPQYKYMSDLIGVGILSGSGSKWRKHRKLVTPNYGKRAVESYNEVCYRETKILIDNLNKVHQAGVLDIYKHIVKTTSYIVCQSLIGLTREETLRIPCLQNVIDESPRLYDFIFDRMTKWYLQIDPVYWLTESYKIQKKIMRDISEMNMFIINNRKEALTDINEDYLELLNSEQDSVKNTKLSVIDRLILSQELNHKELIEETFTIFTSSQEATAKITSFLLLMMAYHPKCQDELYSEILNVIGNNYGPITDDYLKHMPYLEKCVKEVLRLYPIGVMLQRTVKEDVEISTCTLPAGSSLVVPIFNLHRDPRFWEDPEAFDPERFSTENMKKRNPFCYIPFSLGPMDCLGRFVAAKFIKTIAIMVLHEFRLSSVNDYKDLNVVMAISAKSANGYPVILTPRKQCN